MLLHMVQIHNICLAHISNGNAVPVNVHVVFQLKSDNLF